MKKNERVALLFLVMGTVLFALGPATLKLMTTMGGRFGLQFPGAISFCNVLFVGNFCAALVTLMVYGAGPLFRELLALPRRTKRWLALGGIVSTIYPALLFTALERTSVINIVLLSRFNGIVYVALAYLFYRSVVKRAEVLGYGVIGSGVMALVLISNDGLTLRSGEILVLLATVFFALTEFISKTVLEDCSIEAYVFFRNLVSSGIFFVLAVSLFDFGHFADAFRGELWILMVIYAGFAVVAAQLFWLKATRALSVKTIANSQLLNPAFSIGFAYLLLDEVPMPLEWMVMAVILLGMLIPKLSDWRQHRREANRVLFSPGLVGFQ